MFKSWEKRNEALLTKIKKQSFRAYQLAVSNYGRKYGWNIEFEGKVIGELIKPKFEDMFWESYEVISIAEAYNSILFNHDRWLASEFKFKNKEIEAYAEHAFSGGSQSDLKEKGKIIMRALYLNGNTALENKLLNKYARFYNSKRRK